MSKGKISLYVVKDGESFTGYMIKIVGHPEESGVPASIFEVEMWREIEQLRHMIETKDAAIALLVDQLGKPT